MDRQFHYGSLPPPPGYVSIRTNLAVGAGVSEETEGQDTGAEAVAGGVAGADPAAVALALGSASREKADAFLDKQGTLADEQRELVADQRHHLHVQLKQLYLGIWEKRLGVLLRIATAFTGLAIAAGLAFMVRDASQSSGFLIEPFSVPPDLAAKGLTGEVVAAKLLDHLSEMRNQTNALSRAQSYTNDRNQAAIKLEIPETGVSLNELDHFLREKLGHDIRITGEIIRTASGVSLTARVGPEGGESVTGLEADFDRLVQKSAEGVYRLTQGYRYGMYLASHHRLDEAIRVTKASSQIGSTPEDRAYSQAYQGVLSGEKDGIGAEERLLKQVIDAEPDNSVAQSYYANEHRIKDLPELNIRDLKKTLSLLSSDRLGLYPASTILILRAFWQGVIESQLGDFHNAEPAITGFIKLGGASSVKVLADRAENEAREHDLALARATLLDAASVQYDPLAGHTAIASIRSRMKIDSEEMNWAAVLSEADAIAPMVQKYPGMRSFLPTTTVPLTAYAEARLGKFADAEAHISATAADCYDCLITRARIAELQGQHPRADWWFARAIDGQKSIPFAYCYWGQALMGRGNLDGAIAKFTIANQKGPKFADPLEMWGEALMAKNQSHLALAKFAEAEKHAPNWGRLHLKWGEALGYAGRKDEARAQYQKASTLDLTAADKAELARVSAHG